MSSLEHTTQHPPFNSAASDSGFDTDTSSNTMALVIDVQDFSRMDAVDATNYAKKLAENLKSLREQGVSITWVTMRKDAQLYKPKNIDSGAFPQVRDIEELREMGFHGIDPEHENHEIFRDFLLNHGPITDEAVSVKSLKSALVEPEDASDKPEYQASLEAECGEPLSEYFGSGTTTLAGYMRGQGIQNTILMGAVSSHCVSETAVSAAVKGFNPQIITDSVLSWQGDEDKVDPRTSLLHWRGTAGDEVAFDTYHQEKITTKIADIVSDHTRGFTSDHMKAISSIGFASSAMLPHKFVSNGFGSGLAHQPEVA